MAFATLSSPVVVPPDRASHYIYCLIHPQTEDVWYVGKSVNPKRRWKQARYGERSNAAQWVRDLLSLGLQPRICILEQCDDKAAAIARERWWMERMCWRGEPLLNVRWGEGAGSVIWRLSHFGDATRAKLSAANKARMMNPEMRAKLARVNLGRKCSAETRAKIAAALRGRHREPFSAEWRANLSAAKKQRMHGPVGAETRAKIARAILGRKHSAETRAKISKIVKLRWEQARAAKSRHTKGATR